VLADQTHTGPLLVQRPFYPEGEGACHVVLLHPPGGVVGGDRLRIDAALGCGAHALLTTPAAGKFYRSAGPEAEQVQDFRIAADACLEWLPQETIVYSAARAALRTEVRAAAGARFMGWEVLCLGRPASGEAFSAGWCHSTLELWRDGRRVLTERARFAGGDALLAAPWGLAGYPVTATFVATCDDAALVEAARQAALAVAVEGLFAVTRLDGVLVARYLGLHAESARRKLVPVWDTVRRGLLGRAAVLPRIWYT